MSSSGRVRTALAVAAALAVTAAVATPAPAQKSAALDDATIVAIFDAANTAEMETGDLATQRGASAEVREFGAMLARDHEMVRQQGRDLAAKLGVTPTPPKPDQGAKDHAKALAGLRALTGTEFDLAFLRREVEFHRAVIEAINGTLLPAIQNDEVKALVKKVAPAFQAHMQMAQELQKKLATAKAGDHASAS
jgi:putative membrane protein